MVILTALTSLTGLQFFVLRGNNIPQIGEGRELARRIFLCKHQLRGWRDWQYHDHTSSEEEKVVVPSGAERSHFKFFVEGSLIVTSVDRCCW